MTVEEHLREYRRLYGQMYPTRDSLEKTENLWLAWSSDGHERPDLAKIVRNCLKMEEQFFRELVECTAEAQDQRLPLYHLPFRLNEYNCCAWNAADGYIVLIDDDFFSLLFMLCMLVSLDALGHVQDDELPEVQTMIRRILNDHWISGTPFDLCEQPLFYRLIKRNYDSTNFGNYLFQSVKAFILLHEIGHHALSHTAGTRYLNWSLGKQTPPVAVDSHDHIMELEADAYALRHFLKLLKSKDNSRQTFFEYALPFAPELLFQIALRLDIFKVARTGNPASYHSHPHPEHRIAALREKGMPVDNELCKDLMDSIDRCIPRE